MDNGLRTVKMVEVSGGCEFRPNPDDLDVTCENDAVVVQEGALPWGEKVRFWLCEAHKN